MTPELEAIEMWLFVVQVREEVGVVEVLEVGG